MTMDLVCMDGKTLLESAQYSNIVHALGLTRRGGRGRFGRRWAYRNYFAAGEADVQSWRDLEAKGLARQICKPGSLRPFHTFEVTPEGMAASDVLKYIPAEIMDEAKG